MNVLKNTPLSPGPGQRPDEVAIMEAYRAIDRTREALSARMTTRRSARASDCQTIFMPPASRQTPHSA